MSKEEYIEKKRKKPGRSRKAPILGAVAVIVLVVGALAFYETQSREPLSNTVYCGVFQYVVFPAQSVVGGSTRTVNETVTTAVSYTTTTTTGRVGYTYSNATSTVFLNTILTSQEQAGVETICKYISTNSTSSSSSR